MDAPVLAHIGEVPVWPPTAAEDGTLPPLLPSLRAARAPCLGRAITVIRYGAESDRFSLLDCAGGVADGALDRLSVLARPPEVARPELPLPDEPSGDRGEWVDGVKMVPPRVLWLLGELSAAFPYRAIYIYSGYRPAAADAAKDGHKHGGKPAPEPAAGTKRAGHGGLHEGARALDLAIHGIDPSRVYEACRKLPDTGCGYYPNHPFVHVDVRRPGLVRAAWIDVSAPGEPSVYVRSWPGVTDADVVMAP